MNRQKATEVIKDYLTSYVETLTDHSAKGNRKAYVCPICGSGTVGEWILADNLSNPHEPEYLLRRFNWHK